MSDNNGVAEASAEAAVALLGGAVTDAAERPPNFSKVLEFAALVELALGVFVVLAWTALALVVVAAVAEIDRAGEGTSPHCTTKRDAVSRASSGGTDARRCKMRTRM